MPMVIIGTCCHQISSYQAADFTSTCVTIIGPFFHLYWNEDVSGSHLEVSGNSASPSDNVLRLEFVQCVFLGLHPLIRLGVTENLTDVHW